MTEKDEHLHLLQRIFPASLTHVEAGVRSSHGRHRQPLVSLSHLSTHTDKGCHRHLSTHLHRLSSPPATVTCQHTDTDCTRQTQMSSYPPSINTFCHRHHRSTHRLAVTTQTQTVTITCQHKNASYHKTDKGRRHDLSSLTHSVTVTCQHIDAHCHHTNKDCHNYLSRQLHSLTPLLAK